MHSSLFLLCLTILSVSAAPLPEHEALRNQGNTFAFTSVNDIKNAVLSKDNEKIKKHLNEFQTYLDQAVQLNNAMSKDLKTVKDLDQLIFFGTVESYKHKAISCSIILQFCYEWLSERMSVHNSLESIRADIFDAKNELEEKVRNIERQMETKYETDSEEEKISNDILLKGNLNDRHFILKTNEAVKKIKALIKTL